MKFEAQVGKALWCVTYSKELNAIATGGADTSIKLWSLNLKDSDEPEEEKNDDTEILQYDFNIKENTQNIPFEIKDSDQYFIRSLCYCMIDKHFYLFASTNLGTIYTWTNDSGEASDGSEALSLNLKYIHSNIANPSTPTDEFSIIDICCTNLTLQTEGEPKNLIFLVAAFEGNTEKQSKSQFLTFDLDKNLGKFLTTFQC